MEHTEVHQVVERLQVLEESIRLFYLPWISRRRSDRSLTFAAFMEEISGTPPFPIDYPSDDEERMSLVRRAGGLRPIVESLLGERFLVRFGQRYNPWLEAFNKDDRNPRVVSSLNALLQFTNEAIGKLESAELISFFTQSFQPRSIQRPKVLIAHDGGRELRNRVETECWRMMLEPIVVEEQTSLNESVDTKVDRFLDQCQFAIIIARLERGIKQDGRQFPRGNIIDEIGRIRTKLNDHYVILLEEGLGLPTNLATGVVYETFHEDYFERALLKVIKSLRYHKIL